MSDGETDRRAGPWRRPRTWPPRRLPHVRCGRPPARGRPGRAAAQRAASRASSRRPCCRRGRRTPVPTTPNDRQSGEWHVAVHAMRRCAAHQRRGEARRHGGALRGGPRVSATTARLGRCRHALQSGERSIEQQTWLGFAQFRPHRAPSKFRRGCAQRTTAESARMAAPFEQWYWGTPPVTRIYS